MTVPSLSEHPGGRPRDAERADDHPSSQDAFGAEHGALARYFVVIGTDLARRVCGSLQSAGHDVCHLGRPTDEEMRAALDGEVAGVAIVFDDDVESLRYALTAEHIRPNVPLVVTVFDRTVAEQLRRVVPNCRVTSPAEVAAPVLLAACLQPDLLALIPAPSRPRRGPGPGPSTGLGARPTPVHLGVRAEGDTVRLEPYRAPRSLRVRAWFGKIRGQLRPHDGSSRIMLTGLAGILAVLLADWTWSVTLRHRAPVEALFEAARTVSTVGPADAHGSDTYLVFSALAMLVTVVFTAVFTAGMVDRLLAPRSVGILGPRALPRGGHVVVVGLGQVGLRLCTELQRLGVGVIAVERNPAAPNLRLAKALGVPVVVADATDRFVLRRLGLHQAQALAAVASDEGDNIAVSIASLAVAPELRLVMRAGDHDAIAETRSLFKIGRVHDLNTLSAAYTTATLTGLRPHAVLAHGNQLLLERPDGTFAPWPHPDRCTHSHDPDHTPARETAAIPT